ncbi:hypothetical protein KFE98_09710 [bacterium SCSIO 12741]|nr:hypothetical protein KFE98_09710 [bacterium SCSIO 12741]
MFNRRNIALFVLALGLLSCQKETCEDPIPSISFKEIERSTTNTIVKINTRDCDGDIGLTQADTAGEFKYNAFVDIRGFQNGKWNDTVHIFQDIRYVDILDDSGRVIGVEEIREELNYYYRVPVVDNNSRSDLYEAVIELDMGASYFGFDTFRLEVKIKDRALNESNTIISQTLLGFPQ